MNDACKAALATNDPWEWRGEKLWHRRALSNQVAVVRRPAVWTKFVQLVYADQNRSGGVRRSLGDLIKELDETSIAVNVGAGGVQYENVANLEIADGPSIDIVGFGSDLPFKAGSVDLVIMQEVLEHIADFQKVIDEVWRVLKPGGLYYCQVPFQIGFHPGPYDYWRFSRQGLEHLYREPNWRIRELNISLGHGSGFYRIAVEFVAVTVSCIWSRAYKPTKALAALGLYPFKLFDLITSRSPESDRIPGGYFCVVEKIEASESGISKFDGSNPSL